jgi:glutathione S-transferase
VSLYQDGQTMRLYYHPLSSNSRRVLLTAYHLGLNLELVSVDLSRGEHKTPEYLRLNPNGKIPILVEGGFHLWESHAIMQYLADKLEQDIYPQDVIAAPLMHTSAAQLPVTEFENLQAWFARVQSLDAWTKSSV